MFHVSKFQNINVNVYQLTANWMSFFWVVFAWITFTNRLLHSIAVLNVDLRFVGDYWLIFPIGNPVESLGLGNQLRRSASINSIIAVLTIYYL